MAGEAGPTESWEWGHTKHQQGRTAGAWNSRYQMFVKQSRNAEGTTRPQASFSITILFQTHPVNKPNPKPKTHRTRGTVALGVYISVFVLPTPLKISCVSHAIHKNPAMPKKTPHQCKCLRSITNQCCRWPQLNSRLTVSTGTKSDAFHTHCKSQKSKSASSKHFTLIFRVKI